MEGNQRSYGELLAELKRVTAERDEYKRAIGAIQLETVRMIGRPAEFNEALFKRADELNLSVRSANILQNASIEYIWQLVKLSEEQVLKLKNSGRKSLSEIREVLDKIGLSLGMTLPEHFPENKK